MAPERGHPLHGMYNPAAREPSGAFDTSKVAKYDDDARAGANSVKATKEIIQKYEYIELDTIPFTRSIYSSYANNVELRLRTTPRLYIYYIHRMALNQWSMTSDTRSEFFMARWNEDDATTSKSSTCCCDLIIYQLDNITK